MTLPPIQGLVKIDSYCVQDFGKLCRSCGNCSSQTKRQVQISQVIAKNGKLLAGVNSNYGDVATIDTKSNSYTSVKSICDTFQGNSSGKEPTTLTKNQSNSNCKFRRQLFEPNFSGLAELGVVFDFTHSLPNMTSFTHYTSFDTTLNVSEPRVLQALVTYLFEANNTS
ncbi:pectate lyase [Rhizoctonia solani]|uniref:Pectate lyase n=1 Tax=Rhizoctonia solani TaxID=456999 RepID=A0A8H8T183_9AGAM|nr:pectate lyase [Rhizoctonia solani]QRW25104.1 pectate lyase [Rhizoctonia solani]